MTLPDNEVLDPQQVLERCNHAADLGAMMLEMFARTLPADLASLDEAVAAADWPKAVAQAHKTRGAAATLAAYRLASVLDAMERRLEEELVDAAAARDVMASVHAESTRLLDVIPRVVARLRALA